MKYSIDKHKTHFELHFLIHINFDFLKDSTELPFQPATTKTENSPDKEKATPSALNYSCDLCPMKFFKKERYDAHQRKHQGLKQWQCQHCEKAYEKWFNLKVHIRVKHPEKTDEKPEFICGINNCGKKYIVKVSRDSVI